MPCLGCTHALVGLECASPLQKKRILLNTLFGGRSSLAWLSYNFDCKSFTPLYCCGWRKERDDFQAVKYAGLLRRLLFNAAEWDSPWFCHAHSDGTGGDWLSFPIPVPETFYHHRERFHSTHSRRISPNCRGWDMRAGSGGNIKGELGRKHRQRAIRASGIPNFQDSGVFTHFLHLRTSCSILDLPWWEFFS